MHALKGVLQIETSGTGGIRARIRRVASYATAVRSVGRSGRETNPKLTCHLDHSVGGQSIRRLLFYTVWLTMN
jgi:hypothetical protein